VKPIRIYQTVSLGSSVNRDYPRRVDFSQPLKSKVRGDVDRLLIIGALFVLAGLCEIGGGYLVWGWMRESKPLLWALIGGLILAAYGVVAALQPITEFGRTYAAYGGIFIALALVWGVVVDGFRPDRWDILGAFIAVVGVVVMVAPSR
jgi:small multidrug resistance family-3 protein